MYPCLLTQRVAQVALTSPPSALRRDSQVALCLNQTLGLSDSTTHEVMGLENKYSMRVVTSWYCRNDQQADAAFRLIRLHLARSFVASFSCHGRVMWA